MKPIRCEKGHFYDSEKYMECPHCLNGLESKEKPAFNPAGKNGSGTLSSNTGLKSGNTTGKSEHKTAEEIIQMIKKKELPKDADIKNNMNGCLYGPPDMMTNHNPTSASGTFSIFNGGAEEILGDAANPATIPQENPPAGSGSNHSVSLEIKAATDYEPASNKTVQYYANGKTGQPVVGWLVCVDGEEWGKSFELKPGKNRIGRSATMDIAILGDNSISRESHAVIMFDERHSQFIMAVNECGGMVYVNDEVLVSNVSLQSRDMIEIGKTKLLFIPLCGAEFDWENPIKRIQTKEQVKVSESLSSNMVQKKEASDSVVSEHTERNYQYCITCGYKNPIEGTYCQMCGSPIYLG